jgi:hypothetical protein
MTVAKIFEVKLLKTHYIKVICIKLTAAIKQKGLT